MRAKKKKKKKKNNPFAFRLQNTNAAASVFLKKKKLKKEKKNPRHRITPQPLVIFSVVSFEVCFLKQKLNKWILLSSLSVVSRVSAWDEMNCQALSSSIISSTQLTTPTALHAASANTYSMPNRKSLFVPRFQRPTGKRGFTLVPSFLFWSYASSTSVPLFVPLKSSISCRKELLRG